MPAVQRSTAGIVKPYLAVLAAKISQKKER